MFQLDYNKCRNSGAFVYRGPTVYAHMVFNTAAMQMTASCSCPPPG